MENLTHDPRTKSVIKDAICEFLYQPVQRQFKTRIDTLIHRNTIMGGFTHKHFIYRGVVYNSEATPPTIKKNRLVPALRADMEEYLLDQIKLNQEELPFVVGFINQMLNSSSDLTDYLRVLPESVHHPIRTLMGTCPCRTTSLPEDRVESLKERNKASIDMMKMRLAANLLI